MIPSLGVSQNPGDVFKLKNTLYGLKQAPRAWFEKFSIVIASVSFCSSDYDFALFLKTTLHDPIIQSLYVDDMIFTGVDVDGIVELKLQLARQFEIKDVGLLCYFLGIEVVYSPRGYLLSQSKYIANILELARCHTLISSGDLCLMTGDLCLVLVRCLTPIIRQFVKFRDMPENKRKY